VICDGREEAHEEALTTPQNSSIVSRAVAPGRGARARSAVVIEIRGCGGAGAGAAT